MHITAAATAEYSAVLVDGLVCAAYLESTADVIRIIITVTGNMMDTRHTPGIYLRGMYVSVRIFYEEACLCTLYTSLFQLPSDIM